jgi:uncharacterized protein (TIGR04222 family)
MDLLNWIAHMRGPEFLVFYSVFALLAVCLSAVLARRCDPLPVGAALPTQPNAGSDPYEFAWLRDRERGMITTALFALRQQAAVRIANRMAERTGATPGPLGAVEGCVYAALAVPRKLSELLADASLRAAVGRTGSRYEAKYTAAGFATTPTERRRGWLAMLAGLGIVLGLGAFKLVAALSTGHRNVGFLILIAIVVTIAIAAACWPRRLNARGRAYLKELKTSYGAWGQSVARTPSAEAMLPLYVGLLGPMVLAGTAYEDFKRELRPVLSSGNGGGCGSGGDGGGGGCGGGGCGGGCGGCGG